MEKQTVIVIGGGASGMICAGFAACENIKVILIEKNEKLGKKIYITGKGRCNVSNTDIGGDFLQNVISNSKFLTSAISKFNYFDTVDLFTKYGVELKTERGGRVFPVSDKSSDIISGLTRFLLDKNVEVKLNEKVVKITKVSDKYQVDTISGRYLADKVVIATGGLSYQSTGSTGDGFKFAANLGLNVVPLVAGLVPIKLKESTTELEGLSLKNVRVTVSKTGYNLTSEIGEMLFTSDGVSGPLILTLSSKINKLDAASLSLNIDLKPALSIEELDKRIIKDFAEFNNKEFKNSLDLLLPKKLIPVMIRRSGIDETKKVNLITSKERKDLAELIKCFSFSIKQLYNIDSAVITSGGVDVLELNPKTMESKKMPGLYFCGEVIDVDALTGGYNLQIAFSTGYCAGVSISKQDS